MKVLIDVGNTSLKVALQQEGELSFCHVTNIPWQSVNELIYACVGKSELLDEQLVIAKHYHIPCFEAAVTKQLGGLLCGYENVSNLGIDRWIALIACYTLFPNKACIVIDAGTATTIDVLTPDGQHLGGWIIPGLDLMTSSLTQNTQRVFDDNTTQFVAELGTNTPNGLKNGALMATLGAIEQAKLQLTAQNPTIIFAGGYGKMLSEHFQGGIFDEMLVMKGLNYWRNLTQ
ncbi:type III pantothenate kinase [Pseudoalteromonas sp. MMG010]|uniref:type III pantothenate kinase n=1 Tax=Pseudoalteromonas sp. MMG010 TaxID=2822685 RepID=UPI001B3A166E|nr:type III pantothenate kinase [Pseudoalteromonas sp. MMG010]MBQ4834504.1 type III pantothenate kinase [Pseudoalteromonas sp. MMG010]